MKRSLPLLAALAGLCVLAAAPAPPPVALQYDEISRMVLAPATPPPPGNFADDYQAATSVTPMPSMPPRRHGFGALGAMMGGAMGDPSAAMGMMNEMRAGRLVRYTVYPSKGWIRTDDPIARTAVIAKCAQHQYITLDLAAKTYTIADTEPQTNCFPMMQQHEGRGGPPHEDESPGTEDITVDATTKDLGPLTIDGIATKGTASNISVTTANATGSCSRSGNADLSTTTYMSSIHAPRAFCLLANAPAVPTSAMQAMSRGGCTPTVHGHADMTFDLSNVTNLAMYSLITMQAEDARRGGSRQVGMLTERGHVAWLSQGDADPLFAIPPDFTEAK